MAPKVVDRFLGNDGFPPCARKRTLVLTTALALSHVVEAGVFDAFPYVDHAMHAVFDAEVLQFVGTANAEALEDILRASGDTRWQPLLVTLGGDTFVDIDDPLGENTPRRALLSLGVGDFRNTSVGPYQEMIIAFPACESAKAMQLPCSNFVACQARLPDCAHTYMLRSFVSREVALKRVRAAGVEASFAREFVFKVDTLGDDRLLHFTVLGPNGEKVLDGAVEAAMSSEGSSDTGDDGYHLQKYVGSPGVLGKGTGQARYLCGFSTGTDVRPARQAGPLKAGDLVAGLGVGIEGVLHLPALRVVQLPSWGVTRPEATPDASATTGRPATQAGRPPPPTPASAPQRRAPWVSGTTPRTHEAAVQGSLGAPAASAEFPWQHYAAAGSEGGGIAGAGETGDLDVGAARADGLDIGSGTATMTRRKGEAPIHTHRQSGYDL